MTVNTNTISNFLLNRTSVIEDDHELKRVNLSII